MKRRFLSQPVASIASPAPALAACRSFAAPPHREGGKAVERGLLPLCEEIAGSLLRRKLEYADATRAVREVRAELTGRLPGCDDRRAGWLVDLALEVLHVKARGRYQRTALELSELIARAGNQLRDVADN